MFHLASRVRQAWDVRDFHHLQSSFLGHVGGQTPAEEEQRRGLTNHRDGLVDRARVGQIALDEIRNFLQALGQHARFICTQLARTANLHRENRQCGHHV